MIGVCTAVIGDVAGHLGCFIYLKDCVNAIAFVALGTSVPGIKTFLYEEFEAFSDVLVHCLIILQLQKSKPFARMRVLQKYDCFDNSSKWLRLEP